MTSAGTGRKAVKALVVAVLLVVAVVALFAWVFPWIEQRMEDPSLPTGSARFGAPTHRPG